MEIVKVCIGERDRSADLGVEIVAAAETRAGRPGPRFPFPAHSALTLKQAGTEAEYLAQFQTLLTIRHVVNPSFAVPRRPGVAGLLAARLRDWLWRQVHHRIARIVDQQNGINELVVFGLTIQNQALRAELDALKADRGVAGPPPESRA